MIEVLEFVFRSFWTFAGTVILLGLTVVAISEFHPFSGVTIHRHGRD